MQLKVIKFSYYVFPLSLQIFVSCFKAVPWDSFFTLETKFKTQMF